ncbi:MAG TPA: GNAT family N-acetyltransferase [Mycobacteriales bacterium]|nr:GNAT family N-acetyltransferase [Mycobacteriales bacterium]
MSSITVSVAGPADLDALVASVCALFAEDAGAHDPWMDVQWPVREGAAYYASIADNPACLLAVAHDTSLDGGRVVGHLIGKISEPVSVRPSRFAILESLRVAPEARNQGVGSLLVDEFFRWARQHQAEQASVTAFAANTAAQRFYTRHGFAPTSLTLRAAV